MSSFIRSGNWRLDCFINLSSKGTFNVSCLSSIDVWDGEDYKFELVYFGVSWTESYWGIGSFWSSSFFSSSSSSIIVLLAEGFSFRVGKTEFYTSVSAKLMDPVIELLFSFI